MTFYPGLHFDCDFRTDAGQRCLRWVTCAPRVVIPDSLAFHRPIRIMTDLHACDLHQTAFDVRTYLSAERRAKIEREAKRVRGDTFRPDFDAAMVEPVLVTTPEYRDFLQHYLGKVLYVEP